MDSYVIEMKDIKKSFWCVKALNGVSVSLKEKEILALVEENGAGKSTLIKVLSGVYNLYSGEIFINNKKVNITFPFVSKELGIAVIYQELVLANDLSVMEEIFEISDRVMVLKDGGVARDLNPKTCTKGNILRYMTGKEITNLYPKKERRIEKTVLKIDNVIRKRKFHNINLELHQHEILGISGKGKEIVVVGVFGKKTSVSIALVQDKEINIKGTLMYKREDCVGAQIEWKENQFQFDQLIYKIIPFEEYPKAYQLIDDNKEQALKILV